MFMLVSRWKQPILRQIMEHARGGCNTAAEINQLVDRFRNRINFCHSIGDAAQRWAREREFTEGALLVEFGDPFSDWVCWWELGRHGKNKEAVTNLDLLVDFEIADQTPYLLAKRYGFFLAQYGEPMGDLLSVEGGPIIDRL